MFADTDAIIKKHQKEIDDKQKNRADLEKKNKCFYGVLLCVFIVIVFIFVAFVSADVASMDKKLVKQTSVINAQAGKVK